MSPHSDPLVRMVVAAGTAHDPRHFWESVASRILESHAADRVEIVYSDEFAAGTVEVGDRATSRPPTEHVWDGSDDRRARVRVWAGAVDPERLAREATTAAELASLVGRRALLEHERRLGAFLVELSRWMRTANTDPRELLAYTVHSAMTLTEASGALVVEQIDGVTQVTAAVGDGEGFRDVEQHLAASIFTRVMQSERPTLLERFDEEPDVPVPESFRVRLRGAMIVPLGPSAPGTLSVFRVADHPHGGEGFALADLTYLQAVAAHIGGALELARAVVAARHAALRLSAMVNGSPLPLALLDRTGTLVETNSAWAELFGLDERDPIRPGTLAEFALALDRATPDEAIRLSKSGVPWRGRAEVMRDKEHRKCDAIFTALDGAEGEILVALHDRTEEIRAQRELVAREKLATLGTIASGVAHEVNNPLAAIRMEAELLGLGDPAPEVSEAVKVIVTEVDRAARIAKSLLRLSYQSEDSMEDVALDRLLDNIVDVRAPALEAEGTVLRGTIAPDLPKVFARAGDLEQMFLNLVQNAEHAVHGTEGASIHITAETVDAAVRVTVGDSGPGVDAALRTRIFDPFFTTRAPGKGRGLGLAMCQRIVSELGGKIWIDEGSSEGARFVVELPVAGS